MKKLLLCMLCALTLTGCGDVKEIKSEYEEAREEQIDSRRFLEINLDGPGRIYVDKETRVQYLYFGNGYGGGVSVLVDSDGEPLLYEGEF